MWPFKSKIRLVKIYDGEEEYTVNGRTVIFKRKFYRTKLPPMLIKLILRFCSRNEMASRFPKLTFMFDDSGSIGESNRIAYVLPNDVEVGNYIVYVSVDPILTHPSELYPTLTHELTHLWQYDVNKDLRMARKAGSRLTEIFEKKRYLTRNMTAVDLREMLYNFMNQSLYVEGIALYAEEHSRGTVKFNDKVFNSLYSIPPSTR